MGIWRIPSGELQCFVAAVTHQSQCSIHKGFCYVHHSLLPLLGEKSWEHCRKFNMMQN